ncbi:MAG: cation:proton antiporter [Planctomycetota bacterium]
MHVGIELTVVLVACLALAAGALLRMAARRVGLPYTVGMLVLGMATGFLLHALAESGDLPESIAGMAEGPPLTAELVLFVFLPALVFESAISLDAFAFAKDLAVVLLLAIPAMLLTTVLVAFLLVPLTSGSWMWSLPVALVFGALISATDPVAVVALLREVGAPKRLALLIEGESLLNDGTAIVAFGVLLAALEAAAPGSGIDAGAATVDFLRVVGGGVGVGLGLGLLGTLLLSRVFNEPTVEITLTIVLAYLAMAVAEGLLHVSGVMAVVVVGLWMAGPGRTAISPEVVHVQHRFWEMLAHIANTLIFFLAGVVIAGQVAGTAMAGTAMEDLPIVVGAWVGVMVIRFTVTFAFLPLMNRVGRNISGKEAAVMAWGGLRGAVSLALALMVLNRDSIDPDVRNQIMRITAGVVLMTLVINGTTCGWLLRKLGFSDVPAGQMFARLRGRSAALEGVRLGVKQSQAKDHLQMSVYRSVNRDLKERRKVLDGALEETRRHLDESSDVERAAAVWRRALAMERRSYEEAFASGTLSAQPLQLLELDLDAHLHRLAKGDLEPPRTRSSKTRTLRQPLLEFLRRRGIRPKALQKRDFTLLFEFARAEREAAESVLARLESIEAAEGAGETLELIRSTYKLFKFRSQERLEDLRVFVPEIASAVETQIAHRIALNVEAREIRRLRADGVMDDATANEELARVEESAAGLARRAIHLELPSPLDLLHATRLFATVERKTLEHIESATEEQVLSPFENLFREGDRGRDLFLIARGAVHVVKAVGEGEEIVNVLGAGTVVGEMALLSGKSRNATIRAKTSVVVVRVKGDTLLELMEDNEILEKGILEAYAHHALDNQMRGDPAWRGVTHDQRLEWIGGRAQHKGGVDEPVETDGAPWIFLMTGEIRGPAGGLKSPALVPGSMVLGAKVVEPARWVPLPEPPGNGNWP